MATKYTGPASNATVCDECGGPTYLFQSGSIWCPDEDHHAGGHFVVRVAFERAPVKTGAVVKVRAATGSKPAPVHGYMKDGVLTNVHDDPDSSLNVRIREKATAHALSLNPKDEDEFNAGYDAFVKSVK